MFWGYCAASGTECFECVHGIVKSGDYQGILECNVQPSIRKLGLRRRSWIFQQNNDPKHTSKSTQELFKTKLWTVLQWPAMSPDLNPIEHLWRRRSENSSWEKAPFKSGRTGAICTRVGQTARREVSEAHSWLLEALDCSYFVQRKCDQILLRIWKPCAHKQPELPQFTYFGKYVFIVRIPPSV